MPNAIKARAAAAFVCAALSISAAHANDRVTFRDVLKPNGHERSKAEKIADGDACGTSGPEHTVNVIMPVFEKCMQAKGWALDHYTADPAVHVHGTLTGYTDTKGDAEGHPRYDDEFHADERACKKHKSPDVEQCLKDSGWERIYTKHGPVAHRAPSQPQPEPTWIDPDTGLTCHNTGIATVCSNY
jgi:hypothetical protein